MRVLSVSRQPFAIENLAAETFGGTRTVKKLNSLQQLCEVEVGVVLLGGRACL
jgi:hypothetical protein